MSYHPDLRLEVLLNHDIAFYKQHLFGAAQVFHKQTGTRYGLAPSITRAANRIAGAVGGR